jgi:hypothetical protein
VNSIENEDKLTSFITSSTQRIYIYENPCVT